MTDTSPRAIDKKVTAIVMFGPPSNTDGFKPASYYQVTIDPNMVSPKGDYIRFDQTFQATELHGWQRVAALTVCEILGDAEDYEKPPSGYSVIEGATVTMRVIDG